MGMPFQKRPHQVMCKEMQVQQEGEPHCSLPLPVGKLQRKQRWSHLGGSEDKGKQQAEVTNCSKEKSAARGERLAQ